jgi:hypothetical protein
MNMSLLYVKTCMLCVLSSFLILFAHQATATTLARLTLPQLTSSATIVARARCMRSRSAWRNGEIWTVTSFRAVEIWKGGLPARFQVWMIGGRSGQFTSYVPGVPRFRPGDEVVLFLEPTRGGMLSITAWGEGTFRIRRDPLSGEARVAQDTAAMPVFDPLTKRFVMSGICDWPLEKLKNRVLAAISDEVLKRGKK